MHTSKLIEEIIQKVFQADEVCCLQGGADVGAYLSGLDFDHIFLQDPKEWAHWSCKQPQKTLHRDFGIGRKESGAC